MKVILLSLVLVCAVQAISPENFNIKFQPTLLRANDPRLNIKDHLENIINNVLAQALKALQSIQNGINKIVSKILDVLTAIEQNTTEALGNIIAHVTEQVEELQSAGQCIAEQSDAIRNITTQAQTNLNICWKTASNQLEIVHQSLSEHRNAILDEIKAIHDILSSCLSQNPLLWIGCVKQTSEAVVNSINEIIELGKEAIGTAVPRIVAIHKGAEVCIGKVQESAKSQINVIIQEIRDCINNESIETTNQSTQTTSQSNTQTTNQSY